ncbi:MAG: GNAT family N-acetyltransferase [Wenzhouxiangella sp.]
MSSDFGYGGFCFPRLSPSKQHDAYLIAYRSCVIPVLLVRIVIRDESPADISAIHAVTKAAFLSATHTDHTEHYIVDALRKADALRISLVAEQGGTVVGHVAVSPVSVSDGSTEWLGLGPVSVIPELQGQGIGSLLVTEALRRLQENGAAGCVVLGDPAYYSRFGFKACAEITLPGLPPEYFQALALTSRMPRGVVTYHEAFSARG